MSRNMLLTAALGAPGLSARRLRRLRGEASLDRSTRHWLVAASGGTCRAGMGYLHLDSGWPLARHAHRQGLVSALARQPQSHAGGDRTPCLEDAVGSRDSHGAAAAGLDGACRARVAAGDFRPLAQAPAVRAFL